MYVGLALCAGTVLAEASLRAPESLASASQRRMRRGARLAIVAALSGGALLALRLGDFDEATLEVIFSSGAGAAIALQIAGAALLLASVGDDAFAARVRISNGAIALASFAFAGHAAALGLIEGLIACLHVAAAAWWVGSLFILRDACAQLTPAAPTDLVLDFSRRAAFVVGALALIGVGLILLLMDFTRDPWLTPYARLLIVKVFGASAVLSLAAYNKYRLTPRLVGNETGAAAALQRGINVELVLIGVVATITAILTTYLSPHES